MQVNKMKKKYTGERLETFILTRDAVDHLHRYAIAKTYVKNKKVLDIACGEGYGSNLLSETASVVFGVDIAADAIEKAKLKYKKENLLFKRGSTSAIPLEDCSVDVVISFETIEHHNKHEEMMAEIKRVLKPSGIAMVSTPDKHYYSDVRNFKNKFHIKELYKDDFIALMAKNFSNLQVLNQQYVNGNSVIQDEEIAVKMKFYNGSFLKIIEEKSVPMYLIGVASNSDFEKQSSTIFNGLEFAKAHTEFLISNVRKSTTFRIGTIILAPFQLIKKIFN
jgi:2-polyprenyl-3-methyl-5-hydroxy-6-metoxy-1,4-benzoquinol methylase